MYDADPQFEQYLARFSRYCAPTAIASVFGVEPIEAARLIATDPSHEGYRAAKEAAAAKPARFHRRRRPYGTSYATLDRVLGAHTRMHTYDWHRPYLTVAQWLRLFPHREAVVGVDGHVLHARNGKVVADTRSNNSMRARVREVWFVDGLPAESVRARLTAAGLRASEV